MLVERVESRSDGVHPIFRKRIDSDEKVHFPLMLDEGVESVPMESIGFIGHE